ncbi:MAG: GHKL domain-containing protein [Cellvibrionaceae bacterium]
MGFSITSAESEQLYTLAIPEVMKGIANSYGRDFFQSVTESLARVIGADYTFIARISDDQSESRTIALCSGTEVVDNFSYALEDTPCADVVDDSICVYPEGICRLYPKDQLLIDMGIEGYIGAPLYSRDHSVLGLVVALYKRPIANADFCRSIFEYFSGIIASEIISSEYAEELQELNASLEKRVEQRTNELEELNDQLKAFAYSVSHDLKAPVRAIKGFSEALIEDFYKELPSDGQQYLDSISKSAEKMDQIISDMLALAKATRQVLDFEWVDFSALCLRELESLKASDPARAVEVNIAPDISLYGDQGQLRILVQNLLSNAWKYSAHTPSARIDVTKNHSNDHMTIEVRDNGCGFDMAQVHRLFGLFSRLHTDQEYEGSGIGLVTVKRIVERHGGEISVVAEKDKGAAVTLRWPDNVA